MTDPSEPLDEPLMTEPRALVEKLVRNVAWSETGSADTPKTSFGTGPVSDSATASRPASTLPRLGPHQPRPSRRIDSAAQPIWNDREIDQQCTEIHYARRFARTTTRYSETRLAHHFA